MEQKRKKQQINVDVLINIDFHLQTRVIIDMDKIIIGIRLITTNINLYIFCLNYSDGF